MLTADGGGKVGAADAVDVPRQLAFKARTRMVVNPLRALLAEGGKGAGDRVFRTRFQRGGDGQ